MAEPHVSETMDAIVGDFKSLIGVDLNSLLSLGDPEVRKAATEAARKLNEMLPVDHFLRSSYAERLMGFMISRIENVGNKQKSPVVKVFIEKSTDFLDKFIDAFYGKAAGAAAHKTAEKTSDPRLDETFEAAAKDFMKKSYARLAKTQEEGGDVTALLKKIREEMQCMKMMHKLFAEGNKAPSKPASSDVPPKTSTWTWKKSMASFEKKINSKCVELEEKNRLKKESNQKRREEIEANKPKISFFSWISLLPWRLLRMVIFGPKKKATVTTSLTP